MSTASKTEFAIERVDGPGCRHVFVDGNQKITASNGSFLEPAANAFSLPQVVTCPRRTPSCERFCYVHNLETHQGAVHDCYKHNLETITALLAIGGLYADRWALALGEWISAHAEGGFRWHVSGDLFSYEYARWVGDVVQASDGIPHWIYTRSFHLLDALIGSWRSRPPEITVNLSADRDNYWLARRVSDEWDGLRVCYTITSLDEVELANVESLRDGDVVFPDYSLRGVGMRAHVWRGKESGLWQALSSAARRKVCPVDAYGKSENNRCGPCRKCLDR